MNRAEVGRMSIDKNGFEDGSMKGGKHKNQLFRDTAAIHWKATTLLICLYGIVKEFRPATPFLTPYLVSSFKNFTDTELYSEIYPFWTYSYLIALIPIFFLTDILRYKTIIVLEAACLCATWALLVWGTNIRQMQLMQIVFGIASAAEIAYYSYMYAVVDQKHYKRITSYIRCAALVGKFLAFALAQLLISFRYGSYLLLNQISFASVCIILIIAVMLPPVSSKVIANKVQTADNRKMERNDLQKSGTEDNDDPVECEKSRANVLAVDNDILAYFVSIWNHFQIFRTNKVVLKWSLWWALTSCGIYQVYNYVQTLWATMQKDGEDTKNGLTECVNTMIGALIAFLVQYMHVNWVKCGEVALFVTSSIAALLVFALSQTTDIWIAYVLYVTLAAIYHMLMTAASANIACELNSASYGLVFGWNTFLALVLQTLLTIAVADKHGFALDIRTQFIVYSSYFGVVAFIFMLILLYKCIIEPHHHPHQSSTHISQRSSIELEQLQTYD